jgi:hypothetical protein
MVIGCIVGGKDRTGQFLLLGQTTLYVGPRFVPAARDYRWAVTNWRTSSCRSSELSAN